MRFEFGADIGSLIFGLLSTIAASLLLPKEQDTRGYFVLTAHYFFVLPSIIYATFNPVGWEYIASLGIFIFFIYIASLYPVRGFYAPGVKSETLAKALCVPVIFSLAFLALLGGLKNFSLDIDAVYQYRRETAENLPDVFGYIFFNVSNAIIPSSVVLALHLRSKLLALVGVVSGILLFAMSHHKSILFISLAVVLFYVIFRKIRNVRMYAVFPIALVLLGCVEIVYNTYFATTREPGYLTSYMVRRALYVPAMADAAAVEIFSETAKYFWSASRISFGFLQNPHGETPPVFLAMNIFNDPGMSLNSGVIGSGFAQAGILGVSMYSIVTALIMSFINSVGARVGHPLVAALSLPIILQIFTTTDLVTSILTHGLLLLIVILIYLPPDKVIVGYRSR